MGGGVEAIVLYCTTVSHHIYCCKLGVRSTAALSIHNLSAGNAFKFCRKDACSAGELLSRDPSRGALTSIMSPLSASPHGAAGRVTSVHPRTATTGAFVRLPTGAPESQQKPQHARSRVPDERIPTDTDQRLAYRVTAMLDPTPVTAPPTEQVSSIH